VFQVFASAIGLSRFALPDMDEVAKVGHSHYNQELRGGEGHMEVAKLILNVVKNKSHMTVSVKPFGCMPSSGVSDGVQTVITSLYPEAIFCAVETSGEGSVNFQSRVQMFLCAQQELQQALDSHGITREQAQAFLAGSRYGKALYRAPHYAAGSGADLIHHIGPLVGKGPLGRARVHAQRALRHAKGVATEGVPAVAAKLREVAPYVPSVARLAASEGVALVPKLSGQLRSWVQSKVMLSETDQHAVAQAERVQEVVPSITAQPRRAPKPAQALHVMA